MAAGKKAQPAGRALHDLFREVFALRALLARRMDQVHGQTGLSTPQRRIARQLHRLGPATVPDVAARLGVSRQSIQVVCNELVAAGLIEFTENPRHKRSRLVVLTAAGRRALQQAQRREEAFLAQVLPDIEAEDAAAARELLARIRKALDDALKIG